MSAEQDFWIGNLPVRRHTNCGVGPASLLQSFAGGLGNANPYGQSSSSYHLHLT